MPLVEARPRIVFLHYSAPPVVGGVEAVIAEQVRLFSAAGFSTLVVAGRNASLPDPSLGPIVMIPEMDSENALYLEAASDLMKGRIPDTFKRLESAIEKGLQQVLFPDDIVIAHNVLTTHFNLALTAALHHLVSENHIPRLVVWCHDISRHVNPERRETQYHGLPWDLLRLRLPNATYVAVSTSRQQTLAKILGCSPDAIRVIPNGVDPVRLLGLSAVVQHLVQAYDLFSADLIILMPVRITRVKNIEFSMRVVRHLKDLGLAVRLVVSGPPDPHAPDIPDYIAELRTVRDGLGLQREIRFVHDGTDRYPAPLDLDESAVGEFYRASDLLLMPSLREGFGMPVLEAGLVDRPVFATDIPVTRELPDFQFLIAKDEPPESVARRIQDWAQKDAAHHLRVSVRRQFTWEGIFDRQILPLVETAEGGRPGDRNG
jgi:glycosyltransferase involved in cell wall biosynthesis